MAQMETVLRNFIGTHIGWESFYNEFRLLESDFNFFTLFMKREAKSSFNFEVRITRGMSNKVFEDLWNSYGRYGDSSTLETVYALFCALKLIIVELNSDGRKLEDKVIKEMVTYVERYGDIKVSNYVGDFVGCSHSCIYVSKALTEIMGEEVKDELQNQGERSTGIRK